MSDFICYVVVKVSQKLNYRTPDDAYKRAER